MKPDKTISEEEAREALYQYLKNWRPGALFFNRLVDCIPKEKLVDLINEDALQACVMELGTKYNYQIKDDQ